MIRKFGNRVAQELSKEAAACYGLSFTILGLALLLGLTQAMAEVVKNPAAHVAFASPKSAHVQMSLISNESVAVQSKTSKAPAHIVR
jgi:hypothetical protein